MRYEKNRKIAGIDEYKFQKIMKIMIIPVIILILVLVIVLTDKKDDAETSAAPDTQTVTTISENTESETASDTEISTDDASVAPDDNLYVHDFDSAGIQKNTDEEVSELIQKYQRAKITADSTLMYEVFGRTDTEGKDALQARLDSEKEAYESYENTEIYTTAGLEDGSYLAYVLSDVKFTGIDTPAPMLIWAYMVPDENGKLYIKEPETLTAEENELVDKISASEDVKLLDAQMRSELATAVTSDAKLAALYEIWAEGGSGGNGSDSGDAQQSDNGDATGTNTDDDSEVDPDIVVISE